MCTGHPLIVSLTEELSALIDDWEDPDKPDGLDPTRLVEALRVTANGNEISIGLGPAADTEERVQIVAMLHNEPHILSDRTFARCPTASNAPLTEC